MKLDCNFEINNKIIRSETYLEQKQDDCSIVATVFPCEIISDFTSDCSLESMIDSSDLLLDKTSGRIYEERTKHCIKGNTQEYKVKLSSAKLVSENPPKPHDTVLLQFYLTNIPYSFKPFIHTHEQEGKEPEIYQTDFTAIKITGKPKIVIKPHSEGAISHILEVDEVTFADLENVIALIDSICFLISFASGCMCSMARIQVLHDTKIVHLEYISPENTKFKEGNKVIYREEDVIQFIESTYTDYMSSVNIYKLKKLISLGILAKHTPYIENKTLLICNFLEILRYNYALNVGHFTQTEDDFYWADRRNDKNVSFNAILKDFCQTNNLQRWIYLYTKIRNEIVHQGEVIGNDDEEKIKNYLDLHHFCDRVILTLLNWDRVSGYYIPINQKNRNTETKFTR
ncbi:MAG: hypothetical protein EAZ77_13015 [Nostocales cyanobacterium]|nr:MAG: hypothetical protein EAZ77_13015 [Nostocales cyanobacterium]